MARGPLAAHPKVVHTRAELTSPEARNALAGVDVLWHLGAQLWRSRQGTQIDVNIGGTENVLAAEPAHVVFASSAAVYGAHPDNPVPLSEDAPPRPNAEVPYAWHKLEGERMCLRTGRAAVLRISAVLGGHADPRVVRAARGYRMAVPALAGTPQALQFLDEDDAAAGLLAAGTRRAEGVYNLATADWLDAAGVALVSRGRVVALPRRAALAASEMGYRLGLLPFGADRAALIGGPLALDASRARRDLGWAPRRTSAEVLAAQLAGR